MAYFWRTMGVVAAILLLCAGFIVAAQGGTGSISGAITEADGATPVSGVYVTLGAASPGAQFYQMWTGANGVYQFPNVVPGDYVLCASHDRYVYTCHDGKRGYQSADGITITAGAALTHFNIPLPRRASISGRVYAPNGTGVKASLGVWDNPALSAPHGAGDTNPDGTYTIYVNPGTFALLVYQNTHGRMFYGGGLSRAEADLITVGVGDMLTGIDVHFAPPGSITGVISEADPPGGVPTPIVNAKVSVYRQTSGIVYASALTDAAGVYHLFNLPNDIVRLEVSAPGYVTKSYGDVPSSAYAPHIVVYPAPAVQTANVQLERTGDVTGRLYAPDGVTPLANRRVRWQTDFVMGQTHCTNAAGEYIMDDAPLNQLFYVFAEGHRCDNALPNYKAEFWDNSETITNAVPLWANETSPVTGIDFIAETIGYPPLPPTSGGGGSGDSGRSSTTGSIGGAIYAPDGVTPLRGRVDLYRVEAGIVTMTRSIGVGSDGEYGFVALPPGTYRLKVKPQGYLAEYYPDAASLEDALTISVAAGQQVRQINFIVNPGAVINGVIRDSATGLPSRIPSIRVVDSNRQEVEWGGRVSDDGSYEVVVPPGWYTIFADNTAYGAGRFYGGAVTLDDALYVEAVADAPAAGIDITLGRGGEVTGTVYAPDGVTGVANVSVRISQPGVPFSYATCTNNRGIYRHPKAMLDVPNLVRVEGYCDGSPFPYLPEFWEDVYDEGAATPVMLHDRQRYATGINFTLEAGGSISGVITGGALPGSDDAPVVIANGVVNVYKAEIFIGVPIATVPVNADGSYTVNGLEPGLYRVMATAPGYVQEYYQEYFIYFIAPPISVSAESVTTGIDIELDPAMTVSGTVTGMDGITPIANIPVYFAATGYEIIYFCTDANGQYTIDIAPTNAVFRVFALDDPLPKYGIFPCGGDLNNYRDPQDPNGLDPHYYHPGAEMLTVNFALETGGRITGRITRPDGITPIPNTSVLIYAPSAAYPDYVRTDDDGNYISPVLPAGVGYRIGVESFGRTGEAFYGGANYASATEVTVTAGATTSNINIAAPYLSGTSSLFGITLAGDGITPLDTAEVTLYNAMRYFVDSTVTDSSGSFSFGSIPSGTYYLSANHAHYRPENYKDAAFFTSMTPISVNGATTGIEIVFDGVNSISGTIRDALTNLPMSGISVDVSGTGGFVGTTSAMDGTYTVYVPAPGTFRIYALSLANGSSGSYRQPPESEQATPVIVNAGDHLTGLDIFLPRTGEIVGSVTADGIGLACVGVNAIPVGESSSYGTSTNANGNYWLEFILGEAYLVHTAADEINCGHEGYIDEYWQEAPNSDFATPITLDYRNRVRGGIDFTLVPVGTPVTLNGSLTIAGRPDIPVRVVITPEAGGAAVYDQTIQTDEDGIFTVSGIAPGRYQVWVKGEKVLAVKRTVTLAAGPTGVDFGVLRAGDADGNNQIGLTDFSILASSFGKQEGDDGYDARADFNGDGMISLIDFSLLASNYGQAGEVSS